jgi:3-phenylpropionate/trans-cinnamate dioxygenase ferredoxin reductase component
MPDYTYLIVGGGMTAAAAVDGIRETDGKGSIGIISAETHPPYNRPLLSKGLWKGKPLEKIWRHTPKQNVTLHLGRTAQQLDPASKRVTDDQGTAYRYEKLLLATGGTPRRLMFGGDEIIYFRTLDDYQRLRELSAKHEHFAIIGGGFIGSEVAAALATNGKRVTMVFPEAGICSRIFPTELRDFVNDYYRKKGVEILPEKMIAGLETRAGKSVLKVRDAHDQSEQELVADGVVAGIGIRPNVELAQSAGLEVKNGIVVDASLRSSQADIYAAGDVANFHNPLLGQRIRVEHEDNANTMGRLAGQAMAGRTVAYDHLPFFYSDLFDLGYEAVGETDSRLETVADWTEPLHKGVIYYLKEGRVRGVLLWNVWEQVDAARRLIAEPGPFDAQNLKGRLPTPAA